MTVVAERNGQRLLDLINDLLDIEKIESGKLTLSPEQIAIDDVVREAMVLNKAFGDRFHVRFELAGMPSEVVNSVCSVLARLAFDITMGSAGKLKLLVMCEEAHRYVPRDDQAGFACRCGDREFVSSAPAVVPAARPKMRRRPTRCRRRRAS